MPPVLRYAFAALTLAVLAGGPWWYKSYHGRHTRHFHVVRPGVLYRSGQLSLDGLKRVVHDYGIRSIVCLREGDMPDDQKEEEWARKVYINHVRIPPRPWWGSDGSVPAEKGLAAFRAVLDDPANYPVLVHCYAGVHRTGAYCAVYRMDYEGWTNREALAEMRLLGYQEDDWDVLDYLTAYRPRPARPVPALAVGRPAGQTASTP